MTSSPPITYTYSAKVTNIVDGDTYDITVDLGFNMTYGIRVRLEHIDTEETWRVDRTTESYKNGMAAKKRVTDLILNKTITIKTYKDTTVFGRYSAEIFLPDGSLLSDILRAEGYEKKINPKD